jgi:hypothetical protein
MSGRESVTASARARFERETRLEIVCLANSAKLGAYCFAGIDSATGEWVRPIGSGEHGPVTFTEQSLSGGNLARLLEMISIPVGPPAPEVGQPENRPLAEGEWRKVRALTADEAVELLDRLVTEEPIFGTTGKAVPIDLVESGAVSSSLAIVAPAEIEWRYEGGNKLYAEFEHAGYELSLKVTDPVFTRRFRGDAPDTYTFNDDEDVATYLTVSLPEAWKGAHWKLVAGVMRL